MQRNVLPPATDVCEESYRTLDTLARGVSELKQQIAYSRELIDDSRDAISRAVGPASAPSLPESRDGG